MLRWNAEHWRRTWFRSAIPRQPAFKAVRSSTRCGVPPGGAVGPFVCTTRDIYGVSLLVAQTTQRASLFLKTWVRSEWRLLKDFWNPGPRAALLQHAVSTSVLAAGGHRWAPAPAAVCAPGPTTSHTSQTCQSLLFQIPPLQTTSFHILTLMHMSCRLPPVSAEPLPYTSLKTSGPPGPAVCFAAIPARALCLMPGLSISPVHRFLHLSFRCGALACCRGAPLAQALALPSFPLPVDTHPISPALVDLQVKGRRIEVPVGLANGSC